MTNSCGTCCNLPSSPWPCRKRRRSPCQRGADGSGCNKIRTYVVLYVVLSPNKNNSNLQLSWLSILTWASILRHWRGRSRRRGILCRGGRRRHSSRTGCRTSTSRGTKTFCFKFLILLRDCKSNRISTVTGANIRDISRIHGKPRSKSSSRKVSMYVNSVV